MGKNKKVENLEQLVEVCTKLLGDSDYLTVKVEWSQHGGRGKKGTREVEWEVYTPKLSHVQGRSPEECWIEVKKRASELKAKSLPILPAKDQLKKTGHSNIPVTPNDNPA